MYWFSGLKVYLLGKWTARLDLWYIVLYFNLSLTIYLRNWGKYEPDAIISQNRSGQGNGASLYASCSYREVFRRWYNQAQNWISTGSLVFRTWYIFKPETWAEHRNTIFLSGLTMVQEASPSPQFRPLWLTCWGDRGEKEKKKRKM